MLMKVINIKKVETKDLSKEPLFTGGKVTGQRLIGPDIDKSLDILLIQFAAGATNVFHTHNTAQILYATEGAGIVATEKEEIILKPGMIAYIPAGENHRHGATKDSAFTHLSVSLPHNTVFPGGFLDH
jgi:quercetin dioxygenase-like cupin family protein